MSWRIVSSSSTTSTTFGGMSADLIGASAGKVIFPPTMPTAGSVVGRRSTSISEGCQRCRAPAERLEQADLLGGELARALEGGPADLDEDRAEQELAAPPVAQGRILLLLGGRPVGVLGLREKVHRQARAGAGRLADRPPVGGRVPRR